MGNNYAFIKSKLNGNVIDIGQVSTKAGAPLDAYPQKTSNDNQLWMLVPDPAGSGYFFIKSKLNGNVIDIEQASTQPGTLLDAYPQNISTAGSTARKQIAKHLSYLFSMVSAEGIEPST